MQAEERDWLISLLAVDQAGPKTVKRIQEGLSCLDQLETVSESFLKALGVGAQTAGKIKNEVNRENVLQRKKWLQANNIKTWTMYDKDYPQGLLHIYDPPLVLYGYGKRFDVLQNPSLSIVGTRMPSVYGKRTAKDFSSQLSEIGWTIVSGMARGIDSEAHWGALREIGSTIAVLGCGIDVVYPKGNEKLYQSIYEKGRILSEYPPGTPPVKGYFPRRNRIISALTMGTMVVEAAGRSGSLITADFALEQGKEVFAIPGSIHSPKSVGPHRLIKQGAKLVSSVEDILEEFPTVKNVVHKKHIEEESSPSQLTMEEALVLRCIEYEEISIEQISSHVSMPMGQLQAALLSLQVKKCISQLPGPRFVRL